MQYVTIVITIRGKKESRQLKREGEPSAAAGTLCTQRYVIAETLPKKSLRR